ncbi:MAG: hypothetical protein Q7U38_02650 [Methylobacter sp.]|nr:hypothetical protein [Methylobacter sp.]MDP2099356.1 hypothetical protein [Methylobacter sp.]MDP2427292.1 hypothetical protein [Methylobacter sp.]MDP3054871.1 hypothetical protein [Methylobacter sp.]MDP3364091.1 hypothetical protein [Methylobacter sp.]
MNWQDPLVNIEKILTDKKAGNNTRTLEREIDVLVYGLNDEEILIVKGGK